jgi:general secretion pathway protein F
MPHFRYRAVTPAGDVVAGEVEAPSREEVIRRIEYLGHLTIEAEVAATGMLSRGSARSGKAPRPREVTIFLRQLALLVGAGLTLEVALQTLGEDASKALAWFAGAIRSSIATGDSFADALEGHPTIIEPTHVAMVRAGEASGKLDVVLRAIVEDRTRRQLLAERISAAIRYPLFLIGSAIVVLMFFLIYVVPQFEPVFRDLGGRLNAGAALVVAASTWLHGNLDLFAGTSVALVLGIWLALSRPRTKGMVVAVFASVPGIAGLSGDRRAARIIGTLGLLIENGVALPTALKILRNIVVEPRYAAAAERVYEQVRNGRRFADALAETELLPPLAVRMLRVGDEMGDLALIARHAAEFYEHKFSIGLDRLMGAIGPVAIIVVSVVVGALIVSIMTGLLSITELAT